MRKMKIVSLAVLAVLLLGLAGCAAKYKDMTEVEKQQVTLEYGGYLR